MRSAAKPLRDSACCRHCYFAPHLCVCDLIRPVASRTRFVVVQHASELPRQSNTGRWVHRALTNSALYIHGESRQDREHDSAAPTIAPLDPTTSFILFPLAGAATADRQPEATAGRGPLTYVLLDGTWGQARRMLARVPGLIDLQHVALPASEPPPRWQGRRARDRNHFCTLEAASRVLSHHGEEQAASRLEATLDLLMERILLMRGRRSSAESWRRRVAARRSAET